MKRHRRRDQTIMRKGYEGYYLRRPNGSIEHVPMKKDSRISRRLMQEMLSASRLGVRVKLWHRGKEVDLKPGELYVILPDPNVEPGPWSPFADDGRIDDARLKAEGFHVIGSMSEEGFQ